MGDCEIKKCRDCKFMDELRKTHWGYYCGKLSERTKRFMEVNKNMDSLDKYRFSPNLHVSMNKVKCDFFEQR